MTPQEKAQKMGENFLHDMQDRNGVDFRRFFENEIAVLLPKYQLRAQTFWHRFQGSPPGELVHEVELAADMGEMNEQREQFAQILKNVYRARYDAQILILERRGLGADGFTAAFNAGAERYSYVLGSGEEPV